MAEQKQTFEQKVARLEQIVKELEGGNVELDKAVALFKEGRALADECEKQLKGTQAEIDKAMSADTSGASASSLDEDEIPF